MLKIKTLSKKELFIIVAIIIVVASGIFVYFQKRTDSPSIPPVPSGLEERINLNPPTEEEKQQAVDNKARIDAEEANRRSQTNNKGTKKSVKPVITYASQNDQKIEIGSYVPGIFEEGGKCTATFTKGRYSIPKEVVATREGNSTYCPMFNATISDLPEKGMWDLTVSYASISSSGMSEITKLEIK